jgi:hypothetical protein
MHGSPHLAQTGDFFLFFPGNLATEIRIEIVWQLIDRRST